MDALTINFKKTDRMVTESSFGCFANLVRYTTYFKISYIYIERILGLKKARPSRKLLKVF